MKRLDNRKGFTIIEASLVLAIAGLIFLMVFIALPALQRSSRDAQRREDMAKLVSSIKKYQTNNRGALPDSTGIVTYDANTTEKTSWRGFYKNYLGADFVDPSGGEAYQLEVTKCEDDLAQGVNCGASLAEAKFPNDYKALIVQSASCSGENAVKTTNPRKLAVLYKLEGGGIYCENT